MFGTQAVATLIAVYGLFMTPLGWGWAALVWGYALVWFLVNDRVKLLAYRLLDPVKAVSKADAKQPHTPDVQAGVKAAFQPSTDAKPQPDASTEPSPGAGTGAEPMPAPAPEPSAETRADAKTPPDPTPQLVKRVHELYGQLGREQVLAVQDWEKAGATERDKPEAGPRK